MASQHYQSHSCVPVACTGFAQEPKIKTADPLLRACGLHKAQKKIKAAEPFYDVQGYSMYSIISIDETCFFNITELHQ